jgi:hypothetical protein
MATRMNRVAVVLCCSLTASSAMADAAFRCGGRLIEPRMTQAAVLQLCGAPTSKTVQVEDVRSGNQVVGKTQVHRWTYESYGATRVLTFDQDTLKAIE